MQHFFKDYTSVPYVETVQIYDQHGNLIEDKHGNGIRDKIYGTCDEELDSIELEL